MMLGLVLLGTPALAQEPTPGQLALARELVTMTGTISTIDTLIPSFAAQVRQQAVTRPDLSKDLDEVLKSLQPELDQRRQQIITASARVYAKYMSEAELKDVVTFFKTPPVRNTSRFSRSSSTTSSRPSRPGATRCRNM